MRDARLPGTSEVARTLGVSQVTLRSWEQRYGIGAAHREDNGRRRYTTEDVDRLRRMRALQAHGMSAGDAARLVLSGSASDVTAAQRRERLADAAERLDLAAVDDLVGDALTALGVATTWTEVVAPVLRDVGERWARRGDRHAMTVEWTLAAAVSRAVDRYPVAAHARRGPVLFVCGPAERHELPARVLSAALNEDGVPAMFLGGLVSLDVLRVLSARLAPAHVVVWSMTSPSADVRVLHTLRAGGVPVRPAGPGWRGLPTVGEPLPPTFAAAAAALSATTPCRTSRAGKARSVVDGDR